VVLVIVRVAVIYDCAHNVSWVRSPVRG